MNPLFWLLVALMILLALALLLPALLRKQTVLSEDDRQANILIGRQRLAELKRQLQQGELSAGQFDDQYLELQQSLHADLQSASVVSGGLREGRWLTPLIVLALPTMALLLYLLLGDVNALQKAASQQNAQQMSGKVDEMVRQLADRLNKQPDDAEGWLMLGRSYLYMERYPEAAAALIQRLRLKPDDAETMLHYADALAMSRNGQLAGEPASWIEKALVLAPDNQDGLWLAGMVRMESGEVAQALVYWRKLQSLLPADSKNRQELAEMIANAEQKLGQAAAPALDIAVHVELDAAARADLQAQDTLFVYAQPLNGPKMPLVIVRKQVADLPLDVTLNDGMAMQSNVHLADYQALRIVARISKSGSAMAQAGDWFGVAETVVPVNNPPIRISINQQTP